MSWIKASMARIAVCLGLVCIGAISGACPLAAQTSDLRLYFFTADGCAPCLQVKPHIEALHAEGYPVMAVDVRAYPQLAQQFQIRATPTVALIREGRQIVSQHSGLIRAATLRQWFSQAGWTHPTPPARGPLAVPTDEGSASVAMRRDPPENEPREPFDSPTMHEGVSRASTAAEQRALDATVRIRVETPDAFSFGTGTVIHNHQQSSLVLTCGHLFRDCQDSGQITVEYDFQGQRRQGTGRLLSMDAEARDLALIEIETPTPIPPVSLAAPDHAVALGTPVFSLGCDRGADPTIRHTQIKNRGLYNQSPKYDIYGRPVIGRSGGGLFTEDGQLIGVCNLAVLNADEGVYSSLENVHAQLQLAGLDHLFAPTSGRTAEPAPPQRLANLDEDLDGAGWDDGTRARMGRIKPVVHNAPVMTAPAAAGPTAGDSEVLIIVRPRDGTGPAQTITIDDPTPQLLRHLQQLHQQRR